MNANWNYPTAIRTGADRIDDLAECCAAAGIKRPLLVTDPGIEPLPPFARVIEAIKRGGLEFGVFSDVKANPSGKNVADGVACYNQGGHDGVVAVGGGSALDAGKAIALMAGQSISIWELEDIGDNWTRAEAGAIAPIVAVPTTAGTGSEVGRASVIVDEEAHVKKIIFHPLMVPQQVILDPALTTGLPAGLTAATGMDALSHNLEALCSPLYHPMAEGIALQGISLIDRWLKVAVSDGENLEARQNMLVASTMGATAFQRGLGAMHALAHPLGALYDAHHGMLNAILMPYVLRANTEAIGEPCARLARILGLPSHGVDGIIRWVLELREAIAIPHRLSDIGITDERANEIGPMAVADPSSGTNPIQFSADQYANLLKGAVHGEL